MNTNDMDPEEYMMLIYQSEFNRIQDAYEKEMAMCDSEVERELVEQKFSEKFTEFFARFRKVMGFNGQATDVK